MRLFDSHAHFDTAAPGGRADDILAAAAEAHVEALCAVGGAAEANAVVMELAARHPEQVICAVGLDRDQAVLSPAELDLSRLRDQAAAPACRAIGEVGLDYHYDPDTASSQRALFEKMLELALELGKPAIIHSREADADTLALLRDYVAEWRRLPGGTERAPAVLHCFTGGGAFADRLLELGLVISFAGILTFNNAASLRDIAAHLPLERLLIETDSPYLAPVPYRGRENQPAYVVRVAETLAQVRGVGLETVADATFANATRFFANDRPQP